MLSRHQTAAAASAMTGVCNCCTANDSCPKSLKGLAGVLGLLAGFFAGKWGKCSAQVDTVCWTT